MRALILLLLPLPTFAACTVDAKGVCVTGAGAARDRLMGPIAPLTASPWGYYQAAVPLVISSIVDTALAHPPSLGAAIDGSSTCTYSDAPSILSCTGSHFTTQTPAGTRLIVAWNTIDGAGTGRLLDTVSSVADDTHLTFTGFQSRATPGINLNVYLVPADSGTYQAAWWQQYQGNYSNSWNYYSTCSAIYRYYYATADVAWLTKARTWADLWWQWSSDHGRVYASAKDVDWLCVHLRALDGHPERMNAIYGAANFYFAGDPTVDATNYGRTVIQDTRERGYFTAILAEGATADTTANGGSDAHHTWYCARLGEQITGWIAHQEPEGFVDIPLFQWVAYPYSGKGNSPWQSNVWIRGWQMAYDVLSDTTSVGCNQPVLAASLLTSISKAVDWAYQYGISKISAGGNGYGFYFVGSPSVGQAYTSGTGTIAASLGSSNIVGTGTNFIGQLACNGTKYVGFLDPLVYHYLSVYKVTACADATHATITPAFGTYSEPLSVTTSTFTIGSAAATNCASNATYCEVLDRPAPQGHPLNVKDFTGNLGWMSIHCGLLVSPPPSGCSKYLAWGDEMFAREFRGPADGPYGTLPPNGTPAYGGSVTDENGNACGLDFYCKDDFAVSLTGGSCGNGCGDGPYSGLGKAFAQTMGFMCSSCYVAYRLMDPIVPPSSGNKLTITGVGSKMTGVIKIP